MTVDDAAQGDQGGVARSGPPFIGLTGAVAAGKSTALAALEELGAAVLSTDEVVHLIYESPDVIERVTERLGDEVVSGGEVDRDAIARKVFNDPAAREWLEQLIWPKVGEMMWAWRKQHEVAEPAPRALVIEVPLLFESGMDAAFDAVVTVTVADELRRERARVRRHEELDARDARHLSQQEKASRSDYVVVNDGSVEDLQARLDAVLSEIQQQLS